MNDIDNDIDNVIEYFSTIAFESNTKKAYKEFLEAIKTQSNKKIETTKVFSILEKLVAEESKFINFINVDEVLYRARIIREMSDLPVLDDSNKYYEGLDKYDSKEPPLNIGLDGRCNIKGMSYLYLAENEYVAGAEAKLESGDIVSIAKFKVKNKLKIINFNDDVSVLPLGENDKDYKIRTNLLITLIMRQFASSTGSYYDYFVTQYITDYFRKAGFDGLAYMSSQSNGKCYVIFNSNSNNIEFVSSELYYSNSKQFNLFCLKDKNQVEINEGSKRLVSDKDLEDLIRRITSSR